MLNKGLLNDPVKILTEDKVTNKDYDKNGKIPCMIFRVCVGHLGQWKV